MASSSIVSFTEKSASESLKLYRLCKEWTKIKRENPNLSDEVQSQIHTVIGKTQLLTDRNGRLTQFHGMVDAFVCGTGEKETTVQDLDGFWELVSIQIQDIYAQFDELQKLKDNNWVSDAPKPKTQVKKKKAVSTKKVDYSHVKSKFVRPPKVSQVKTLQS